MASFPPLIPFKQIHERLQSIFPEGSPNRAHSVWEISARTIFVMLYVGAIEGRNTWMRPDQVARMTDEQSNRRDGTAARSGRKDLERVARAKSPDVGSR